MITFRCDIVLSASLPQLLSQRSPVLPTVEGSKRTSRACAGQRYRCAKIFPYFCANSYAELRRMGYDTKKEITEHGFRTMARAILYQKLPYLDMADQDLP
jgi:hypothetical protein